MKYKFSLVPFPFDDKNTNKVRPCLCLTEPVGTNNLITVAFITSQIRNAHEPSDILLLKSDIYFAETGLRESSAIRLHKVASLPLHLFKRELGSLPSSYHEELDIKLKHLYQLR